MSMLPGTGRRPIWRRLTRDESPLDAADRGVGRGKPRSLEWTRNNSFRLLENGEAYYPRLFEAIASAEQEVLVETYIWLEDEIGTAFGECLIAAAERGVRTRVVADHFGSAIFSDGFRRRLTEAGVDLRLFDPQPTWFRIKTNIFCRLHRKIAVIDGKTAFVGGINITDDQLLAHGSSAKQDFAVEVTGPVVADIRHNMLGGPDDSRAPWWKRGRYWLRRFPRELAHSEDGQALFATRDNNRHAADIEMLYRIAIRHARSEIVLANAYFFPGYRLIRDLIRAARRGVRVKLIVQGKPDFPVTLAIASIIYDDLAAAGVEIYRFTRRPLHAKIAVIDNSWASIGSSNLDPTSLGLNFEANLFVLDEPFNRSVRQSLDQIIASSCEAYTIDSPNTSRLRRVLAAVAYRLTRRMALWGRTIQRRKRRASATV